METKICTKCKSELSLLLEYFHFDKRIGRGFKNHCKKCCNEYKKNKRIIQSAGYYYTDKRIASYFGIDLTNENLLEAKRFQLILKDRIENKKHCIITNEGFYCILCDKKEDILLPISLDKLTIASKAFLKNHNHNEPKGRAI